MNLIDIIKYNSSYKQSSSEEEVRIAVLANINIQLIKPILEYHCALFKINAYVTILGFNNFIEETKSTSFDCYLFFWETINLTEGLKGNYYNLTKEQKEALVNKISAEINITLNQLKNVPLIIFNKFNELVFSFDPLVGHDDFNIAKKLNEFLNSFKQTNLELFQIENLLLNREIDKVFDFRQYYTTSSLYSQDFIFIYAKKIAYFLHQKNGAQKKMLILDADNTLWKGVIGEDGIDGIKCSVNNPIGKIYNEIQLLFKFLKNQGVLLAMCSKNNPEDIQKVFDKKKEMILQSDDFIIKKVNWESKHKNILDIAEEVNIGVDSLVFIDDSIYEIELIKKFLPDVKVLQVPSNLSDYPNQVKDLFALFIGTLKTKEDANKTQQYIEEKKRKIEFANYKDLDEYINSLGLKIILEKNESTSLERCTQLTQKTNQFNLTTKRYKESQIERMQKAKDWLVLSISLKDDYGDYGITGLSIIQLDSKKAILDTFLLSCRILGRKVEQKLFEIIIMELKSRNIKELNAKYIPSKRNNQVRHFLDSRGMQLINKGTNKEVKSYKMNVNDFVKDKNLNIKVIENGKYKL